MSSVYKIDICMTSVIRPKIIEETLNTIVQNVCHGDTSNYRLILNVDPVGEDALPGKIVKIARQRFPNILYNIADEPSFPKAVKWVWSQSDADYVFHWEDDVNILRQIDVNNMVEILNKYDDISSLRLYKAHIPKSNKINTFSCYWNYNQDGFYVAEKWEKQFGLNPILIKKEFVQEAVKLLRDDYNPEKQFRYSQEYMRPLIKKWKYAIYGKPGDKRLVDGRKGQTWKNNIGIDKPKGRTFVQWIKKESS